MESELYPRHVLEEKGFMIGSEMDGASRKGQLLRFNRLDSDYWARFKTMIKERDLTNFGSREKKTREWVKMAKYHHFIYKELEPSMLEYCVAWNSSLPNSSTTFFFLIAKIPG